MEPTISQSFPFEISSIFIQGAKRTDIMHQSFTVNSRIPEFNLLLNLFCKFIKFDSEKQKMSSIGPFDGALGSPLINSCFDKQGKVPEKSGLTHVYPLS